MSGFEQVRHVLKKDARRYWPLVGFLGLLLTADAFMPPDEIRYFGGGVIGSMLGGAGLRGSILTLAMILIAALVIHEDNASHARSFWSSRPIHPLALLVAKGVFLVTALIALPLAFQALAILEFGTAEGMSALLLDSAFQHAGMLAIVAAVSAVTRDLKGTLFLGIAGYAAAGVLSSLLRSNPGIITLGPTPEFAIDVFTLAVCVAVLGFQYSTRRTREAIAALAVFVVAVPAIVATQWNSPMGMTSFEVFDLGPEFEPPEMRVQALEYAPGRRSTRGAGRDRIDAVIETSPTELSIIPRMSSLELRVKTADGKDERSTPSGRLYNPDQRYAPLMPGYEWLGSAGEWAHFDVPVLMAPAGALVQAMDAIEEIELEAEWDAFERRPLGRLAFQEGAVMEAGAMRVRVDSVTYGAEELSVSLLATWVAKSGRGTEPSVGTIRVIAVNDERAEYLLGTSGGNTRHTSSLVLPGPRGVRYKISLRYRLGPIAESDVVLGPEWFETASLLVYANDYVGTFRNRMSTDLSELTRSAARTPDQGAAAGTAGAGAEGRPQS